MKKNFYLVLLTLLPSFIFAQRKSNHCAFEPDSLSIQKMNQYTEALQRLQGNFVPALRAPKRIPIRFVVFAYSNNRPVIGAAAVEQAIRNLNEAFQPANLEFFACETLQRVNSSALSFFDSDREEDRVWNTYGKLGMINIFCFEDIDDGSVSGYTYIPSRNGPEAIFILQEELIQSTLVHEMGHYFGLYHTHGKTNCGKTDELVNDPNCARTGDDICDTPADPNLAGLFCFESLVDSLTCTYTGDARDSKGELYQPDPKNFMSYTLNHCAIQFSEGQYARMRYIAENVRLYSEDCSGKVICPTPVLSLLDSSLTQLRVIWSTNSRSSISQARYRLNADSAWTVLNNLYGTEWLALDLRPCTRLEFQVRSYCVNDFSDWSPSLISHTKGCADAYCGSYGGSESIWVNRISLGSQNFITGDDGGYRFDENTKIALNAGRTYALNLQAGGFTRAKDTLYWRIWIDKNGDDDFEDVDEQIFQGKSLRNALLRGNLALPLTPGNYRLRLSLSRKTWVSPCGVGGIVMETEDYLLSLQSSAIDVPLAIERPIQEQIFLYPNPTRGAFSIQLPQPSQEGDQLEIFSSTGQLLQRKRLDSSLGDQVPAQLNGQASGLYFVRLKLGARIFTERILLQHP